MVDSIYSVFDLSDRDDYGRFLLAHARATGAAEAMLGGDAKLPTWRPRMPLLADDLADLRLDLPVPLKFDTTGDSAWRWGVLYVLEGSRLGGNLLLQRAPISAPRRFLSARHLRGEWATLLRAIDARSLEFGLAWTQAATCGAGACFDLYRRAASNEPGMDDSPPSQPDGVKLP